LLLVLAPFAARAADVALIGVIGDKAAVFALDGGEPKAVKVGQTWNGINVVSVEREQATVEIEGKQRVLRIGQHHRSAAVQGVLQTGQEDPLVLADDPIVKGAVAEMASGEAGADLPQENALIAALDTAESKASAAVDAEDFTGAMAGLAMLRRPIDDFFDHVTVNDPDSAKRERRLNLLMRFRDAVNRVADFSKIEG